MRFTFVIVLHERTNTTISDHTSVIRCLFCWRHYWLQHFPCCDWLSNRCSGDVMNGLTHFSCCGWLSNWSSGDVMNGLNHLASCDWLSIRCAGDVINGFNLLNWFPNSSDWNAIPSIISIPKALISFIPGNADDVQNKVTTQPSS